MTRIIEYERIGSGIVGVVVVDNKRFYIVSELIRALDVPESWTKKYHTSTIRLRRGRRRIIAVTDAQKIIDRAARIDEVYQNITLKRPRLTGPKEESLDLLESA